MNKKKKKKREREQRERERKRKNKTNIRRDKKSGQCSFDVNVRSFGLTMPRKRTQGRQKLHQNDRRNQCQQYHQDDEEPHQMEGQTRIVCSRTELESRSAMHQAEIKRERGKNKVVHSQATTRTTMQVLQKCQETEQEKFLVFFVRVFFRESISS